MDREVELTSYLLRYLLDNGYLKSKKEMAQTFDMTKRVLQHIMNEPQKLKGGSVALGKVLCYMGEHRIPIDAVVRKYLGMDRSDGLSLQQGQLAAYQHLQLPPLENLSDEGENAYIYCRDFLCLLSQYICPACKQWCDPWSSHSITEQNCLLGRVANKLLETIKNTYSQRTWQR